MYCVQCFYVCALCMCKILFCCCYMPMLLLSLLLLFIVYCFYPILLSSKLYINWAFGWWVVAVTVNTVVPSSIQSYDKSLSYHISPVAVAATPAVAVAAYFHNIKCVCLCIYKSVSIFSTTIFLLILFHSLFLLCLRVLHNDHTNSPMISRPWTPKKFHFIVLYVRASVHQVAHIVKWLEAIHKLCITPFH